MIKAVCYTLSYVNEIDVDSMGQLRLISPLTQGGMEIIRGVYGNSVLTEKVIEGDVIVIQRHFPSLYNEYSKIVALARQMGKPIVYEIDDWLLGLPEDHPDRLSHFYVPALLPILEAIIEADLVTVPTHALREKITPLNSQVTVLPNYFDDTIWQLRDISEKKSNVDPVIIGYMGTNSHRPDIESITPVLLEMLHRYSSKIQIHFWGVEPPDILKSFPQIKHIPWYSYSYNDFVQFFQKQNTDIFIAPLIDNLFNRCKSPLKFFEYSALGAPSIFSNIEPYNNIVENGFNGFLANSLEDWQEFLIRLIEDSQLRDQVAINAQKTIREKWLLSKNAYRWKEAYGRLLMDSNREHQKIENSHFIKEFIQSINMQLYDLFKYQTNLINMQQTQLSGYQQQVEEFKHEIENYKEEIRQYVTSSSWRYTRPFRKLNKSLKKLWK